MFHHRCDLTSYNYAKDEECVCVSGEGGRGGAGEQWKNGVRRDLLLKMPILNPT